MKSSWKSCSSVQPGQTQPPEVPHTSIQTPGKPNDISILVATGTYHHPWSWRLKTSCNLLGNVQPTAWLQRGTRALPLPQKQQSQKAPSCCSHTSESSELSKTAIYSPKLPAPPQFTLSGLWWTCITVTPPPQLWAQPQVGLQQPCSAEGQATFQQRPCCSRPSWAEPSHPCLFLCFISPPCSFAPQLQATITNSN